MLTPDLIQFHLDMGGGMLGVRDATNRPAVLEFLYVEVGEEHLVGVAPAYLAPEALVENVADNAQFALVTSRVPGDHRSVQVKGRVTECLPSVVRPDDVRTALALPVQRYPMMPESFDLSRFEVLADLPVHRLRLEIDEVFDQTPGPRAGTPVTR